MRNLLVMMDAQTLDDAIAALALIRTGPAAAGMKDLYVRIQRGLDTARTIHPRLHALLAPQKGVLLYEEDVMGAVAALTDSTLGRGDLFRRALAGTRTAEQREPLRRWFAARARTIGLSDAEVETAWREIARFGAYAFCRAHAAGYGVLAWQAAYLRAHWPAAWAAALCNHHAGMYALWVHVADLQRHGVLFALPCVSARSTAPRSRRSVHGPVRIGLGRVRDLGERTRAQTLAARTEGGPFASLADFLGRVRPDALEARRLVEAGAFDWTGRTRAALLLEVETTQARYAHAEPEGAFRVRRAPIALPELPEFAPHALRAREWDALELGVVAHPLAAHAPALWPADRPASARAEDAPPGFDAACSLGERVGRRVRVTGLMAAARRVPTKQGGRMLFLTLDDGTGLAECTLFPDAYARRAGLTGGGMYVVDRPRREPARRDHHQRRNLQKRCRCSAKGPEISDSEWISAGWCRAVPWRVPARVMHQAGSSPDAAQAPVGASSRNERAPSAGDLTAPRAFAIGGSASGKPECRAAFGFIFSLETERVVTSDFLRRRVVSSSARMTMRRALLKSALPIYRNSQARGHLGILQPR